MFATSMAWLAAGAICGAPPQCAPGAVVSTAGNHNQTFPQPHWDLKYRSGSLQFKKDEWLKGAFLTGAAGSKQTNPMIEISRDEVRAIYFEPKAQKDSDAVQRTPRSGCYQAHYLMPKDDSARGPDVFVVWASSPGRMTRAAERLNARYPVRLVWSDNGVEKELVMTVNHCEYASFLANLRWFAGERWQEIGRESSR
jgi:hypothetical protein